MRKLALAISLLVPFPGAVQLSGVEGPVPVTVQNFARAETDLYFGNTVAEGAFGRLKHSRSMTPIDRQDVVRMNRDTLYSSGVFDLEAAPVTVTLPDPGKRFMSMQALTQDHFTLEVVYAPGSFTYARARAGTRYLYLIVRTLANPDDPTDLSAAHALQDEIRIEQARAGTFEVPSWEKSSQDKARDALAALGSLGGTSVRFGSKDEVDPVSHLIGSAIGWGGNPEHAAVYQSAYPKANDGKTVHRLVVQDVPVDGFWSISLYDAKGFFARNDRNAYSINNLTAEKSPDGSVQVQFGGCDGRVPNCLPIMKGWNYTVRLYRPRAEILNGTWKFPEAVAVK